MWEIHLMFDSSQCCFALCNLQTKVVVNLKGEQCASTIKIKSADFN